VETAALSQAAAEVNAFFTNQVVDNAEIKEGYFLRESPTTTTIIFILLSCPEIHIVIAELYRQVHTSKKDSPIILAGLVMTIYAVAVNVAVAVALSWEQYLQLASTHLSYPFFFLWLYLESCWPLPVRTSDGF